MNKVLLLFILSLAGNTAFCQVRLEKSNHDFGPLNRGDQLYVDFPITNSGTKEAIIFRLETPKEFEVKFTSKTIAPGKTETIRLQYNPLQEGKFSYKLPLYISAWDKAEEIDISGEALYAAQGNIPCPDFSSPSANPELSFYAKLLDMETKEPIANGEVDFYHQGRKLTSVKTNARGEVELTLPLSRYLLHLQAKNYLSEDTAFYLNRNQSDFLFYLQRTEEELLAESINIPTEEGLEQAVQEDPVLVVEEEVSAEAVTDEEELYPNFPLSRYKRNNIVFLVDVSSSMKHNEKLDLLKLAMIDLLDMLRPVDQFALVSYASQTTILLQPAAISDKASIEKLIQQLEASGSTAGAKGIEEASELALAHFLSEGNNQVILATDGSFNQNSSKTPRMVKKYAGKGVRLSVLGIKSGKYTAEAMSELAREGQGSYLQVDTPDDALSEIKNEIKQRSVR